MAEIGLFFQVLATILVSFSILEMYMAYNFFNAFAYFGIPIYRKIIDIEECDIKIPKEQVIVREEGKFYFKGAEIYFIGQYKFWNPFRIQTLIPFKSIGTVKNNYQIEIVSRLPIGPLLAYSFLLITANQAADPNIFLISLLVITVSSIVSFQFERSRLKIMIGELKGLVIR